MEFSPESMRSAFEQRVDELIQRIVEAKKVALSREEVENVLDEQEKLEEDREARQLSNKEYAEKMHAIENSPGIVRFDTIMEFMACLRKMGFSREYVEEVAAHENDHLNKAESLGLRGHYQLFFVKERKGKKIYTGMFPFAVYFFPAGISSEKRRELDLQITGAPKHLSDHDKRIIDTLRKQD